MEFNENRNSHGLKPYICEATKRFLICYKKGTKQEHKKN